MPNTLVSPDAKPKQVIVRYFGHSCFLISESGGRSVIVDPFHDQAGHTVPNTLADVVLVTLDHPAHNNLAAVRGEPKQIITRDGVTDADAITFTGVSARAWRTREQADRGDTTIYAWQMAGLRFCHLGALAIQLSADQIDAIGAVDVLFLPVGGNYTLSADGAMDVVRQLNPRFVFPMHYRTQSTNPSYELDELVPFLELVPLNWPVSQLTGSVITLDPDDVLREGSPTRVIALSPEAR